MNNKPFTMPAHQHIELKEKGITLNADRGLKQRPFANLKMKKGVLTNG